MRHRRKKCSNDNADSGICGFDYGYGSVGHDVGESAGFVGDFGFSYRHHDSCFVVFSVNILGGVAPVIDINAIIIRGIEWGIFAFMALSIPLGSVVIFWNLSLEYFRHDIED